MTSVWTVWFQKVVIVMLSFHFVGENVQLFDFHSDLGNGVRDWILMGTTGKVIFPSKAYSTRIASHFEIRRRYLQARKSINENYSKEIKGVYVMCKLQSLIRSIFLYVLKTRKFYEIRIFIMLWLFPLIQIFTECIMSHPK